jgi:hypothetical protein
VICDSVGAAGSSSGRDQGVIYMYATYDKTGMKRDQITYEKNKGLILLYTARRVQRRAVSGEVSREMRATCVDRSRGGAWRLLASVGGAFDVGSRP